MSLETHIVPHAACPVCFAPLDGVTPTPQTKGGPEPGSFSVCIYCTSVLVFAEDMSLRQITDAEMTDLTPPQRRYLQLVQKVARKSVEEVRAKKARERAERPNA